MPVLVFSECLGPASSIGYSATLTRDINCSPVTILDFELSSNTNNFRHKPKYKCEKMSQGADYETINRTNWDERAAVVSVLAQPDGGSYLIFASMPHLQTTTSTTFLRTRIT